MSYLERFEKAISMVEREYFRATKNFGKFHNAHEGYAVLLEEVDELWENVKLNQNTLKRTELILKEAVQVGTMAIRIIVDCGGYLDE